MDRLRWLFVLVLVLSLGAAANAATYKLDNDLVNMKYDSRAPGFVVDADGNIHVSNRGYDDDGPVGWDSDQHILYHMVGPDGDELIDDTWLTVGYETGRSQLLALPDGTLAFVFSESEEDVYLSVIDPSLDPQDGDDSNATATTPVADGGNTGNGTMSSVQTAAAVTQTEDWTVTFDGSEWEVTGSVSGTLDATATTDTDYLCDVDGGPSILSFHITGGGTGFASGDEFTFSTTASPMLVTPPIPVSGTDGDRNHDARSVVGLDGRILSAWRQGDYQTDDALVQYRLTDLAKASTSVETLWDGGSDEKVYYYGAADIGVISNDVGFHVMFSAYNDSQFSDIYQLIRYTVISPDASEYVVALTPFRFHTEEGSGVRRPQMATLPDGNVLVVYQVHDDDDGYTQLRFMILNPAASGLDGDTLTAPVTPDADAGNTGNGTMSDVEVSVSAPMGAALWTVTCTDDSVAGSEVWSVEDDVDGTHNDATTGVTYVNELGGVVFEITAGGTDFAVGDEFTFTTNNASLVMAESDIDDSRQFHHPYIYADPDGKGIYLSLAEGDNESADDNIFYAVLGYDGSILESPSQVSDGGLDYIDWQFMSAIELSGEKIVISWVQYFNADNGETQMLAVENNPVDFPTITSVDPATGDEGAETEIVITGTNFATDVTVFVGDDELATVTRDSATQITATVPGTLAVDTYDVRVVNPDTLFAVAADAFEVEALSTDDDADDDSGDDDAGDDDAGGDDDATGDDDGGGGDDDDDDDDGGCCGC